MYKNTIDSSSKPIALRQSFYLHQLVFHTLKKLHTYLAHHQFRWESFLNQDKIHTVHYNGKAQEFIVSHTLSHRKDTILIPS